MSSPATTPIQSFVLTGLSTVVGVLFLTVAGKITDKIGQAVMSDATASVVSEVDLFYLSGSLVASVKHAKPVEVKSTGYKTTLLLLSQKQRVCKSALDLECRIACSR